MPGKLNSKRQATYDCLWTEPKRSDIEGEDAAKLLIYLGAERKEGSGSRVSFIMGDRRIKMHFPHQKGAKATLKGYQIEQLREFLIQTGNDQYGSDVNEREDN